MSNLFLLLSLFSDLGPSEQKLDLQRASREWKIEHQLAPWTLRERLFAENATVLERPFHTVKFL